MCDCRTQEEEPPHGARRSSQEDIPIVISAEELYITIVQQNKKGEGSGYMKKTEHIRVLIAGSVSLITFLVYLTSLRNEFVEWDDNYYVYENPDIRRLGIMLLRWAFLGFHVGNWHPLTWISHAVDYALWGLNPLGHDLTSIVLHSVNTFPVVLLVIKLMEISKKTTILSDPFCSPHGPGKCPALMHPRRRF